VTTVLLLAVCALAGAPSITWATMMLYVGGQVPFPSSPPISSALYTANPATANLSRVGQMSYPSGVVPAAFGIGGQLATSPAGDLYGSDSRSLFRLDPLNAAATYIGDLGPGMRCMTFSPNGTLYAQDLSGAIYSVNTQTAARTLVSSGIPTFNDIEFSPSGTMYGIDFESIYTLDLGTASATFFGQFSQGQMRKAAFSSSGILYASDNASLYTVDLSTFVSTNPYPVVSTTKIAAFAETINGSPTATHVYDLAFVPVPEAGSLALLAIGAACLLVGACLRRGRNRRTAAAH